jgi:prevent-host-death family protein
MYEDHAIRISHLRDNLGWAYRKVTQTDIPIIVQRYGRRDVVLVPKWEWDWFKELEAGIKAGRCPVAKEKGVTCPCLPPK